MGVTNDRISLCHVSIAFSKVNAVAAQASQIWETILGIDSLQSLLVSCYCRIFSSWSCDEFDESNIILHMQGVWTKARADDPRRLSSIQECDAAINLWEREVSGSKLVLRSFHGRVFLMRASFSIFCPMCQHSFRAQTPLRKC